MFKCSNCGDKFETHDEYEVDGKKLCPDCADDLTFTCDYCGERFMLSDMDKDGSDDDESMCVYCANLS